MEENEGAKFKNATISKLMMIHFQDDKIRVGADVLSLMGELLQLFVMEAATRAAKQAEADGEQTVDVLHCEKVLPQLALQDVIAGQPKGALQ
uniref:centromere protein X isoform X1 n=1 Tax=Myxine glutinosa TaxID=7769 RepID=UPI00358FD8BF